MKLYYVDGSPFARIIRILIIEWRLDVAVEEVSFPLPPEIDALTPLGQVPLLVEDGAAPVFPTLNIIERIAPLAPADAPFPYDGGARANLTIALSAGDALGQAAYQRWSGLGHVAEDKLGFDPGARNLGRFERVMAWLAAQERTEEVVCLVATVFLQWAQNRGVIDLVEDRRFGRFRAFMERESFVGTMPRVW